MGRKKMINPYRVNFFIEMAAWNKLDELERETGKKKSELMRDAIYRLIDFEDNNIVIAIPQRTQKALAILRHVEWLGRQQKMFDTIPVATETVNLETNTMYWYEAKAYMKLVIEMLRRKGVDCERNKVETRGRCLKTTACNEEGSAFS